MNPLSMSGATPNASASYAAAQSKVALAKAQDDDVLEMPASEGFQLQKVPSLSGLGALRLVSLTGHGLLEFPRSLLELPALRCVDLSENRLTTIPPDIDRMTRLADLDLSQNAIQMIDGEASEFSQVLPALFAMQWLTRVVLQKNHIGAGWQRKLLEFGAKAHVTVLVAGCTEPSAESTS